MGCEALSLDPAGVIPEIAVRLADEGVPLRAIARAIKESSDIVRERLQRAQAAGRLLDLPRDDWPPGFPRDQRALQLSRLVVENRDQLLIAVQQLFNLTPTEVGLLLVMVHHPNLLKNRMHEMSVKTLDVHVCNIRKRLEPFGIEISTLWGQGFQFSADNRRKVMDLILHKVAPHEF
jgi:DNA-binding response OmpR family regulator